MAKRPTEVFRTAARERGEATAQKYANKTGKPFVLFKVSGGYEVRPEELGPPKSSHIVEHTFRRNLHAMKKGAGHGRPASR